MTVQLGEDEREERYDPEPMSSFIEIPHYKRRYGHPGLDRTHPPLQCPAPRIPEPLRGHRCPACARRIRFEDYVTAQDMADTALEHIAGAIGQAWRLTRDMPRWAADLLGVVLLSAGILGIMAYEGLIPR